jgi:uncharacterized lipoprotein YajG
VPKFLIAKSLMVSAAAAALAACAQMPTSEHIVSSAYSQNDQCLKSGTRIRLNDEDCATTVNGRVYSQRELEQTGALSVSEALRKLDPRF